MLHALFQIRPAMPRDPMRLAILSAALIAAWLLVTAQAAAETRTLKMYFTHTKESATITFKRNGRYVKSGLRKANRFLRDWRRKEPTRMDPELLDLVWEVYQKSGSRKPIHVISAYRSPRTNKMLRRRGRGVARKSQHTLGKAMDFFLPDVKVSKLRALGLKQHRGGVGYYRGSFVHLDTGRVRHWPRMSRRQLARVFPRGRTIHVPSNGKPLRGYKTAMANLKRGRNADGSKRGTAIRGGTSLLARLFAGGGRATDDDGDSVEAAKPKPAPRRKAPEKKAEPVVVAKAEPPKLRRKSGDDPFATEAKVAGATAEEAETELVAGLTADRLAVPIRRPSIGLTEEPAVAATEVALATPEATTQILRPAAEIPTPAISPSAILASAQAPQQTAQLKERVVTALAQQRSSTVAQEAAEALAAPRPPAAIQLAALPATTKPASRTLLDERLGPKAAPLGLTVPSRPLEPAVTTKLPEEIEVPLPAPAKPAKLDEAVVLAALKRNEDLIRARLAERAAKVPESTASVPLPRPITSARPEATTLEAPAPTESPAMKSELALGDLDGYSVKVWAVAETTRIGPIAKLVAPAYRKAIEREAPARVLGNGFSSERPSIRSDRFMGRALTRIAFAQLAGLQGGKKLR